MGEKLKIAGSLYLVVALVWVGIQIPIRVVACEGVLGCGVSLAKMPFWALIWPVYWPLSDVVPQWATVALVLWGGPLVAAVLLVHRWQRWAESHLDR